MTARFIISALMLVASGTAAVADTCSVAALEERMDSTERLAWQIADVPAANAPRSWIEGRVNGRQLMLTPSHYAVLSDPAAGWRIELICDTDAAACTRNISAAAPADAIETADALQGCLLGTPIAPVIVAEVAPEPTAPIATVAKADAAPATAASSQRAPAEPVCVTPTYDDLSTGTALQALLIELGADIARDGIVGPKTRAAAAVYLPANLTDAPVAQVFEHIQQKACRAEDGTLSLQQKEQN